jgi:hypothetical protein
MGPAPLLAAQGVAIVTREVARTSLERFVPGESSVPLRSSGVTPTWLEGTLGLRAGGIRSVQVLSEDSGTAARARIAVESEPDVDIPEFLFLKLTPANYLQRMMMQVFDLGANEVFFYQTLSEQVPVRVPHCHAALIDTRRGRNVIILEDLAESALFRDIRDPATAPQAEVVVDAMADQHAAFWGTDRFAGDLRSMTGRSAAANFLGDIVRKRFLGNMKGQAADIVPESVKRQGTIFFERSADIDAMWAAEPQTVLHGDTHLGNLFFEGDEPGFIDWQVARAGAGIRDVAYFTSSSLDIDVRRTVERPLVERYAERLDAAGIEVDFDHLWALYRAGFTEFYTSAVAASEAGDRAQDPEICRVGVERAAAACEDHDSFGVLAALIDGKTV